jgi:multiple sugar transport system permease protein
LAVFFYLPLGLLFWMSFKNWPLLGNVSAAGLANYQELVADSTFESSLWMTLRFTVMTVPLQIAVGYALAVMVRKRRKGVALFRAVYFVPVVLGFATVSYLFVIMLQPGTGIISLVTHALGLSSRNPMWLMNPGQSTMWVVAITVWKTVGTAMILFMAGMQSIPQDLYEASSLDGASRLRQEFAITLPLVRRTTALVTLLCVTGTLLTFDQFYVITHGGPVNSTMTAVMWMYTTAFIRHRLGYAAAMAVTVLIALIVLAGAQMILLRDRRDDE